MTFDNVSFAYPTAEQVSLASLESVAVLDKRSSSQVLEDVSFSVEAGQMIALVGPSGRRQDHDHEPGGPAVRRDRGIRAGGW